ncbi:hypothetical protein ACH5RR_036385 [Cinchona calisaya]|uniref:Protein kinase domain-containing protein n=1 Tax=Cinchona calisaya TaxID=153742 RepID=A0ABD2Y312_9GENT
MLFAYLSHYFLDLIAFCVFVSILLSLIKGRYNGHSDSLKFERGAENKILQQPAMSSTSTAGTRPIFFGNGDGGFSLKELLHSTSKVSWKGTFGTSFKTELKGGNVVLVRRLKGSGLSEIEFRERVQEIGTRLHENLLPLRAYCCHQNERYLLYDYMQMGSLAKLLHGHKTADNTPLTWEVRCRIVYGVARAILYLHTIGSNICHGNIKSSNVLLTDSLDAHLSEFGLARLVSPDYKPNLVGGYRAPEARNAQEVSQASDVYSFGVLLLELLTGNAPIGAITTTTGVDLPKWVRKMFREKPIIDVFDKELLLRHQDHREQMVQLLELAVCCTFQHPNRRPLMAAVLNRIRDTCRLES